MKIAMKFGGMMLVIFLATGLLMLFTLTSLIKIKTIINEQQEYNSPIMITSLSLQKDIIQIQQWLTDISATRAKKGFDDGFQEAENFYNDAVIKLGHIKEMGVDAEVIDLIKNNLDEYYEMGIHMADAYINEGTDAGNAYMEKFDPFAIKMEESLNFLLDEADINYNNGNGMIHQLIENLYKTSIILFSAVILIIILSYIVIKQVVLRRLSMITGIMKEISEGEGDLTKRVPIKSKDEIGKLALYFNSFLNTVHDIVMSIAKMSDRVSKASNDLKTSIQYSAAAAEEVTQSINVIAKITSEQAQSTIEGSKKLNLLGDSIEEIRSHILQATKTSGQVNVMIGQGLQDIGKLLEKTEQSNNATGKVYNSIVRTNESSEKIGEASNLITAIAKRTNLIALNASIEASRAGEHGTSFHVVANEIRDLAKQSAVSTKIIDDMVKNLREDVNNAVSSMREVERLIEELVANVETTGNKYNEISNTVKISGENVEDVNDIGTQMELKKKEVLGIIQNLSEAAQDTAAGTEQASASMEEQTASLEEIVQSSSELTQLSQELQTLIERFIIE